MFSLFPEAWPRCNRKRSQLLVTEAFGWSGQAALSSMFLNGLLLACSSNSFEISTPIIFLNNGEMYSNDFPVPQPKSIAIPFLSACFLKYDGNIFLRSLLKTSNISAS
jgi:hypothetical protein